MSPTTNATDRRTGRFLLSLTVQPDPLPMNRTAQRRLKMLADYGRSLGINVLRMYDDRAHDLAELAADREEQTCS